MAQEKIKLYIDNIPVEVNKGESILKAAEKAGKYIPTLCYLEDINELGACRVCVVELEDPAKIVASCTTPAQEGMQVKTNSKKVRDTRQMNMEFLLSDHDVNCTSCIRNEDCELREVAEFMGIRDIRFPEKQNHREVDKSTPSIKRDPDKCILCRRCVSVCEEIQTVKAIVPDGRGFETIVSPSFYDELGESPCVYCGQCTTVCPTGAITEVEYTEEVWNAIFNSDKHVVVQTAPAVRVGLAEAFNADPGTIVTGQMVAALKKLGFDKVFDTNFAADLTIMEEGTELIERIKQDGTLPLFTSCSPGWIKFLEHQYPETIDHLSSCKSPQQMFGAVAKNYYAEKNNIDKEDMVVVSIMPCTAKKFEATREKMSEDVDYSLTTRELGRMIKQAGLDIMNLEKQEHDKLLGISSGAADIFGTTGGVMEAALRTAYELLTGDELEKIDFDQVRGLTGLKEASVMINDMEVKVAVAHGLGNARIILDKMKNGEEYHFVEFMACPGGCIGGGGQPLAASEDVLDKRMNAIYDIDKNKTLRKSHENPYIQKIYEEFFDEPGSHKAHELLHTEYESRGI